MAKPRKRGKLPGLSWQDFARVIRADGWTRDEAAQHENYKHPKKPGKVSLDKKWKDVSTDNMVFHSVLRQAGLTKKQFADLYWTTRGG
jgi:predicted RNA binding protein YcfA (HicA-like mRNA interferase family)